MDLSDRELLRRFAADRDDTAFRLLVERHLPLVQGVARRVTANGELARDVAQQVFVRLAGRAALIPGDLSLTAWLHRVTRHLAVDLVRSEERRKKRENHAHSTAAMETPPADWSAISPVVDRLVDRLPAADREVLLLRYYRNEPHAEVARQLGLTEAAAKKRATRALGKLRALLGKRGIATSAAALASLLPAHATTPVPGSQVLAVCSAVKGTAIATPTGLNLHLAMTTAQKSAVAAAAVVMLTSVGYSVRDRSVATGGSSPTPAESARAETGDRRERTPRGRPIPSTAAERLERLREIVAIRSLAERTRELIGFIDQLEPGQFPEIAGHFQKLGIPIYRDGGDFSIVLAAWARVHPQAAAEWGLESAESVPSIILSSWGETDPDAAIDWVTRHFPEGPGHDPQSPYALHYVLAGLARQDTEAAVKALGAIPDEKTRTQALIGIASQLSSMNSEVVDRLLAATEEGAGRSRLIAWSIDWLVRDHRPERALELLLADERAQQQTSVLDLFRIWQREDPTGLRSKLPDLAAGDIRNQAVAAVCFGEVNQNPPDTFAFLEKYPDAATDLVIAKLAEDCPLEHIALAAEKIMTITDPVLRDEALTRRLGWWLARDNQEARQWMKENEVPAAVREALENPSTPMEFR